MEGFTAAEQHAVVLEKGAVGSKMCNEVAFLGGDAELLALVHGVDLGLFKEEVLVSHAGLVHRAGLGREADTRT